MTEDERYWELVDYIKSQRPECIYQEGHTFIVYQGKGIQRCHDCGYEENLVAKDDCNHV